jgi:hypothetical protein
MDAKVSHKPCPSFKIVYSRWTNKTGKKNDNHISQNLQIFIV